MGGKRNLSKEALLDHAYLASVLFYDPDTGIFSWKVSPNGRIRVGQQAGTLNGNGHRQIKIDGRFMMAHRLAWFYIHKAWPEDEIDHRDLNKDNNAIGNLREATHMQNCRNRKASPKTNVSGYKGVSLLRGRWHAQIKHKGKCHHLGYFDDPATAHQAYVSASQKYHGSFGRTV